MKRNETLKINIPEPCHQSWSNMTPDSCGRFCATCQKTVIDFTVMTDAQIVDIFRNSETIPCGRFFPEQLNRPLQQPCRAKHFPFYRKLAAAILTLQSFAIVSFAQAKKKPATCHSKNASQQKQQVIKGRLLDIEQNKPVAYLKLQVTGAGIDSFYTATDAAGYFHFSLPGSVQQVCLSAGDITTGFAVNETIDVKQRPACLVLYSYPKHLLPEATAAAPPVITIEQYTRLGGPMATIEPTIKTIYNKQTLWQRMTRPFRKKHR